MQAQFGAYTYNGEWRDGLKHGKGFLRYPNGDVYEGEYRDGRPDGPGRLTDAWGDVHIGQWKGGVIVGKPRTIISEEGEKIGEMPKISVV